MRGHTTLFCGADGRRRAVQCRTATALAEATLYTTSPDFFDASASAAFARVASRVARRRYGTDCYGYAMLAHGCGDLVVESGLKPYDYMAVIAVIEAAGGVVTDWAGRPLTMTSDGTVLAAANPAVHAAAQALLAG